MCGPLVGTVDVVDKLQGVVPVAGSVVDYYRYDLRQPSRLRGAWSKGDLRPFRFFMILLEQLIHQFEEVAANL